MYRVRAAAVRDVHPGRLLVMYAPKFWVSSKFLGLLLRVITVYNTGSRRSKGLRVPHCLAPRDDAGKPIHELGAEGCGQGS